MSRPEWCLFLEQFLLRPVTLRIRAADRRQTGSGMAAADVGREPWRAGGDPRPPQRHARVTLGSAWKELGPLPGGKPTW